MAPGPVAPNVARVQMVMQDANGQLIENVMHAYASAGWGAVNMDSLAQIFIDWWTASVAPLVASSLSLIEVIVTDLTSLNNERVTKQVSPAVPGTLASPQLPNNVTWAVKADIGKRGRGRAGRVFVPGLGEAEATLDAINGATATSWVGALNALIPLVAANSNTPELVVLHRIVDGVKLLTQTHDAIRNFVASDLTLDSMKNRLFGHKKHKLGPL